MEVTITITIFLIALIFLFYILHKNYDKAESPVIVLSTFLSFGIVISFTIILSKAYTIYTGAGDIDMESTGQVGDFIGGTVGTILTAISIILLYKTLQEQQKSFNKSQIENHFFELLKFHRDNVNEIEFGYSEYEKASTFVKGRHFFVTANKQLDFAFAEFEAFFTSSDNDYKINDIYEEKYLTGLKANDGFKKIKFDNFYRLAKIDICYLILFNGVSKNGKCEILEQTKGKYQSPFMKHLLDYFRFKPSKSSKYYSKWKYLFDNKSLISEMESMRQEREDAIENENPYLNNYQYYPDNYNKFYGGHQFRLGHYFRHLYQIVCFVHYNKNLSTADKKNYVRILRGQLSDYEQKMFFYNSLSQLGRIWELSDNMGNAIESKNHLITQYSIIKSISKVTLIDDLRPEQIYPLEKN